MLDAPQYIRDAPDYLPLIAAARALGDRVRWVGTPPTDNSRGMVTCPTCWELDGKRASARELLAAAGLPDYHSLCDSIFRQH